MQLVTVFSLLISLSSGGPVQKSTTPRTVQCELVQLSECSKSCESGFMLMKYVCVEEVKVCECPTNPIYYQCNNRPCLSQNATLLDIFNDAEDQQEEVSDYEYYEDDDDENTAPTKKTKKPKKQ